jgi:predicted amidohydrolase YtcJ
MIIRRAQVFGHSGLSDIRLRDGLIHAVDSVGSLAPDDGEDVLDADGRVVIPGLWDEHVHMGQWASHLRRIDVSEAGSPSEALELMAQAAMSRPDDPVIVGAGMRPATWSVDPDLASIDAVSGAVPWVMFSIDIHSCWANSAALRQFGYESDTGFLTEHDSFGLLGKVEAIDPTTHDQWVAEAEQMAASRGVVGIVDLDMGPTLDNWARRRHGKDSAFTLRVEASVYPDTLHVALERGLRSGDPIAPGVVMGPLKAITDGSLNTKTAYVTSPYVGGDPHGVGTLNYTLEDINDFSSRAHQAGLDVTLHAIGDRANTIMLDVFDSHQMAGRIEHAQLVSAEDVPRFAQLGVTASVQPQHAVDDREVTDVLWSDRADKAFPVKSLLDAGAHVVFGSDAPVSSLDPWVQIAAAVTRTDDEREPWHPEQAISVSQAIACSTRSTLSPGQVADVVVLDADPVWLERALSKKPSELSAALRSLPVWLTVVDGRVSFRGDTEDD